MKTSLAVPFGRFAALTSIGAFSSLLTAQLPSQPLADIIGEIHSGGKYSIPLYSPATDYLTEGADRISQLGSRTIKLWLNSSPNRNYPNFTGLHAFPSCDDMTELLQTTYYADALSRPDFKTYFFVATEFAKPNWKDGLSPAEEAAIIAEFAEATEYLLETYSGTGKTFIFQSWEGDNHLSLDLLDPADWPVAIQGMIDWINARQAGVEAGIAAASGYSDVYVYNACEFNYNPGAASSLPVSAANCVINAVIPYTDCDLYSWSNWASKGTGQEINVIRGLDYARARTPSSSTFGRDNLYMGEFGAYESSFMGSSAPYHSASSDATLSSVIMNQVDYALRWGPRWIVHWAIYDNGLRSGETFNYTTPVSLFENQLVGTWLIRPPGETMNPDYSFITAYGELARLNARRLHHDPLDDLSLASATGSWTIATTNQSWDEDDFSRYYRTTTGTTTSLTYEVDGEIVDLNLKAFIYSSSSNFSPAGRIRGYTSADGVTWSSAFDFSVVDSIAPDPSTPAWERAHLGLPSGGIAAGQHFLKIELYGSTASWATQLADVRIQTRPAATTADELADLTLVEASDNVSLVSGSTAYSEGDTDRLYRNTTSPGYIAYKLRDIGDFSVKLIHYTSAMDSTRFKAYASYDLSTWQEVNLSFDSPVHTDGSWYRTNAHLADPLPTGTRYVIFELIDPTYNWSPQIADVTIEHAEEL
ncbi:MAG: hypothetical protein Q7P63_07180 [Verrucomicrobiota bacterium JB022]|nr:hypothetical protein [Verrucomicrobiota bacterium JB022]